MRRLPALLVSLAMLTLGVTAPLAAGTSTELNATTDTTVDSTLNGTTSTLSNTSGTDGNTTQETTDDAAGTLSGTTNASTTTEVCLAPTACLSYGSDPGPTHARFTLENASQAGPCRLSRDEQAYVCQRPPSCREELAGAPECRPPPACQLVDGNLVRCPVDQRAAAGQGAGGAADRFAGTMDPSAIPRDRRVAARAATLDAAAVANAEVRAGLDELRERYRAAVDALVDRYAAAKSQLRTSYHACLTSGEATEACRERAADALASVRTSLQAQRAEVVERLRGVAEDRIDARCDQLAATLEDTLATYGLPAGALEHLVRPTELGACSGLLASSSEGGGSP